MAAVMAVSGGASDPGLRGGRKLATVWVVVAVGGGATTGADGAVAGGVVFFATVWVGFFGLLLAGGGTTGACATSGAGVSGFSGISSGSCAAMVGAGVNGGNTGFFLLQAAIHNKARTSNEETNLRALLIQELCS